MTTKPAQFALNFGKLVTPTLPERKQVSVQQEKSVVTTDRGVIEETRTKETTVDEDTKETSTKETIIREKIADQMTSKLCYRNMASGRLEEKSISVDELLFTRQYNILNVYVDSTNVPRLVKVEDFLANTSFIMFDRSGDICVKKDNVKPIRKIDADLLSSSLKNGLAQTTLTDGVVVERDKYITIILRGCRPITETQTWEFTDDTTFIGTHPLVSLNALYKMDFEIIPLVNESVKYLDIIALTRAVEGAGIFSRSLDSLTSFKKICSLITSNGNFLVNNDRLTEQLMKIRSISGEEMPEKLTIASALVGQKRLQRQMFNQLISLAEQIIRINGRLCDVAGDLMEIYRILDVQSKRIP